MSNRYKGFLIIMDNEIREEDLDSYLNIFSLIKGVQCVKPYVKGAEDLMSEEKGQMDLARDLQSFLYQKLMGT